MENDDQKLIADFQQGDVSAFDKILDKYEKPLLNFIYRFVGNRSEAEDLTQEVFLRVYRSAKNYQPRAKFSTWLYRIATNLCLDWQRKSRPRGLNRPPQGLDNPWETGEGEMSREIPDLAENSPQVQVEQKQVNQVIKSALLTLSENQRLALTLKIYEDKNYQEISQILGCSISAVESLLFRARQNLKEQLKHLK